MPFAQGIDRRIGHLSEVLAEELAYIARHAADHRERRVVAHRADRFLAIERHRIEDQLHILVGHASRGQAAVELIVVERRICGHVDLGQVVAVAEASDQRTVIGLARDPRLELGIAQQAARLQIDRDHLARAQTSLLGHPVLFQRNHPAFGTDHQQAIIGAGKRQRTQSIAVEPGDRPMAVGHRERGWAVPWLHHGCHVLVHRPVLRRHVGGDLPCLGDQHRLGGGHSLAGAHQQLDRGIEAGGVGRADRDHRLDVVRDAREGEARHLDFVRAHPVPVATDRVDLAIMGQRAERLGEPPLRESVGRIALVKDRHPAGDQRVAHVGIEGRKALCEEKALVDDRLGRERGDVEIAQLRLDDPSLDPPTHDVEPLFELIQRAFGRARPGDHHLFDFRAGFLRLAPDDRDIDRHLPPAINEQPGADQLRLHDRTACILRAQIGARQEHHADRKPPVAQRMAARADRAGEELHRQVEQQARAIAGFPVSVDRPAMPDRGQRLDRAIDHAARRLARNLADQPDAAGIVLAIGMVHPFRCKAERFFVLVDHAAAALGLRCWTR